VELLRENLPDFLKEVPLLYRNKIVFQQDNAGNTQRQNCNKLFE